MCGWNISEGDEDWKRQKDGAIIHNEVYRVVKRLRWADDLEEVHCLALFHNSTIVELLIALFTSSQATHKFLCVSN